MPKYKQNNGAPASAYTADQCTRKRSNWSTNVNPGWIHQQKSPRGFRPGIKLELAKLSSQQKTIDRQLRMIPLSGSYPLYRLDGLSRNFILLFFLEKRKQIPWVDSVHFDHIKKREYYIAVHLFITFLQCETSILLLLKASASKVWTLNIEANSKTKEESWN